MLIGISALTLATALAFGLCISADIYYFIACSLCLFETVIRCILVQENKRLDREEMEMATSTGANRKRIEEAARLEGITFDEALRRKRGFRYLI